MTSARVQFGQVRVSLSNGRGHEHRAESISRLMFDHVQRMVDARCPRLHGGSLSQLSAGPLHLSLDAMDDDAVARASAAEIYRALLERAGGPGPATAETDEPEG